MNSYVSLEEFFMIKNVSKAIQMPNQISPGSCTSSMVDHIFFIFKKSAMRAICSSSSNPICAVINIINSILSSQLQNVSIYPSLPSFFFFLLLLLLLWLTLVLFRKSMKWWRIPNPPLSIELSLLQSTILMSVHRIFPVSSKRLSAKSIKCLETFPRRKKKSSPVCCISMRSQRISSHNRRKSLKSWLLASHPRWEVPQTNWKWSRSRSLLIKILLSSSLT